MFNIGGGELIVIMLIALIVLGPQRLPDAARQIGKTMGDLRRLSSGFQNEMKQALDTADDPSRVAGRRNVLAKDAAAAPSAETGSTDTVEPVAGSIAAVSAQPSTPPEGTPSTPSAPAKASPPARQARKQALKAAPLGKAAAGEKPAAVAKSGAPAKKTAKKASTKVVPKSASRRTPS